MEPIKISVVTATFNRAKLLDNALYTYSLQTMGENEYEYIIVDDASQDDTVEVVKKWQKRGLPLRLMDAAKDLNLPKEPGKWRDGCKLRNAASTYAVGQTIILTHPEIMIPRDALQVMYDSMMAQPKAWHTGIPYWMPSTEWPKGWKKDLRVLREMEGFWDPSWPEPIGFIDYRNQNQEIRQTWESEVFSGMHMNLWRWFGGFREFEVWGSVDIDFMDRRKIVGIPTVIVKSKDSPHKDGYLMFYHQDHGSPRDGDKALQMLKGSHFPTALHARQAGGLFVIYNHGPRERAEDGKISGIIPDHIARYRFASYYTGGKNVLDVPCGTGYGSYVLRATKGCEPAQIVGIDLDGESIEWAHKLYSRPGVSFKQGTMTNLDVPSGSWDMVLSFEGLEHISPDEQKRYVDEMWRVLRPGGTFIVSTPQKGVIPGTPWDKFMLTREELTALFGDGRWINLDPFYQMSYGDPSDPKPGHDPRAQIMLLGGTKK